MCKRLDSVHQRVTDRRIDRQTSCHDIVRAMHTRRAVKTKRLGLASISHVKVSLTERLAYGMGRPSYVMSDVVEPYLDLNLPVRLSFACFYVCFFCTFYCFMGSIPIRIN